MQREAYLALDYVDTELYEELDLMLPPMSDANPATADLNRYINILPHQHTIVSDTNPRCLLIAHILSRRSS